MRWLIGHRRCRTDAARVDVQLQHVTARALIGAPRERVWNGLRRHRASRLQRVLSTLAAWGIDPRSVKRRMCALGWTVEDQVVTCAPPYRYAYRRRCKPLFRAYGGQILLGEYQRTTTEVIWEIEFHAALPGTSWLARRVLDRFIDRALFRLKRDLEVSDPARS
jgi:hypothetical protein